jgi:hypothetical protein
MSATSSRWKILAYLVIGLLIGIGVGYALSLAIVPAAPATVAVKEYTIGMIADLTGKEQITVSKLEMQAS